MNIRYRVMRTVSPLAAIASMGMCLSAMPALAQESAEESDQLIVVTGSYIVGTPEDAALPVDVISAEDLEKQGNPSTLELIKSLPASQGVLGESNQFDSRSQGSEGSGSVNLRGLGSARTLVLLNGRRVVNNPFSGSVDTNAIPSAAIGRLEVLKDGAAATYGSDAIGGVVNFITNSGFEGLQVGGNYSYIDGSEGNYELSAKYGWRGDNADILIAAGWQHRSELDVGDRDWALKPYEQNPEGGYSAAGNPGLILPVLATGSPAAAPSRDVGCVPLGGYLGLSGTTPVCYWQYTAFDNLIEPEDRLQIHGEVTAELSDNVEFHVEAQYARTDVERATSPSYALLQNPSAATNPFNAVRAGFYVPATNPGFALYRTQNPTLVPSFAGGAYMLAYRPLGLGGNPSYPDGATPTFLRYDSWRVSGGLKGEWENGIGWDVNLTYSQQAGSRIARDTIVDRFELALRGLGGANCTGTTPGANGCQWFNPFSNAIQSNPLTGAVNPNYSATVANDPALINWFFAEQETQTTTRLYVFDAVLNGQLPIELPGGAIGWATGVQYRHDFFLSSYSDINDLDVNPCVETPITGSTNCSVRNGPLAFLGGGFDNDLERDVQAAFFEFNLPVLDRFNVQIAGRYEDYKGNVGATFDPKIAARFEINDMFALRASASTTFRGPTQTSLQPGSVTSLQQIAGTFRAVDEFGNPNLEPESAKTYNAGLIFKAGGLRATLDYWAFDFDNPFATQPLGGMNDALFGTTGTANCGVAAYAALQSRYTFNGACGIANIARVRRETVNGPAIQNSGIDLLVDYDFPMDVMGGEVSAGGAFTYMLEYKTDDFVVDGIVVQKAQDFVGLLNYQTSAVPLPQLRGNLYAQWDGGDHNVRMTLNYVDSYEDQRTTIFNANNYGRAVSTDRFTVSDGKTVDANFTVDLSYRLRLPHDMNLSATVTNLLDQDPSFARLDLNYDPFTGNPVGRVIKLGLNKKF